MAEEHQEEVEGHLGEAGKHQAPLFPFYFPATSVLSILHSGGKPKDGCSMLRFPIPKHNGNLLTLYL